MGAELGCEIAPGTFGENLTISDLETAGLAIGDRLHIGDVVLEVTAPAHPVRHLRRVDGRSALRGAFPHR